MDDEMIDDEDTEEDEPIKGTKIIATRPGEITVCCSKDKREYILKYYLKVEGFLSANNWLVKEEQCDEFKDRIHLTFREKATMNIEHFEKICKICNFFKN